jgi:hypothetical protein
MKKNNDALHLQLLFIFHYAAAALTALLYSFPVIYFAVGIILFVMGLTHLQDSESIGMILVGLLLAVIAGGITLVGWALAVCIALAGFGLMKQKWYVFCCVIAGIQCAMPFVRVLGIFTILVLSRSSVQELFGRKTPKAPEIPQTA